VGNEDIISFNLANAALFGSSQTHADDSFSKSRRERVTPKRRRRREKSTSSISYLFVLQLSNISLRVIDSKFNLKSAIVATGDIFIIPHHDLLLPAEPIEIKTVKCYDCGETILACDSREHAASHLRYNIFKIKS
jgi:hypothetical protein